MKKAKNATNFSPIRIWRVGAKCQNAQRHEATTSFAEQRCNHGNSATGQPPAPVALIMSGECID